MKPRGVRKVIKILQVLIAAPFRAAGELLGLLVGRKSSKLTPGRLARRSIRRRMLFAAVPALSGLVVSGGLIGWSTRLSHRNSAHYSENMLRAISHKDAILASRYAQRIFDPGVRGLPDKALQYSQFLADQDDLFQANSILEKIAPDDVPGYPPAHAMRAAAFSKLLSQGISDRYLPVLLWHLQQAGEPTTEALWLAWANYYRFNGKIDLCRESMESAAKINPSHWFSVADLYVLDAKPQLARQAMASAINAFGLNLGKDPLAVEDRLHLALAQARIGEHQQASETLKTGMELDPENEQLLRARNQLDVIRLEQALRQSPNLSQRLELARELVGKSNDPSSTYQNAAEWYQQSQSDSDKQLIWGFLEESYEKLGPDPTLMFVQSVILLQQRRIPQAREKLMETIDAFPKHGFSLNNLAWILATEEPRDLVQAEVYARRAIETDPQAATFHDTLGTIHLEQNLWTAAIAELELALALTPTPNRTKIHGKLARAYEAVGDTALALMHRQQSSGQ